MNQGTVLRPLFFLLLLLLALRLAEAQPVKSLPAYLAESGIPAESDMAFVESWLQSVRSLCADGKQLPSDLSGLPFSFRYDGQAFAPAGNTWHVDGGDIIREPVSENQDWSWQHGQTGLRVTWHVKRFRNYPAVDTLLTFENTGNQDTALVEDVRNLDLKIHQCLPGKSFTIHGAHGGRCGLDDFMPFSREVTSDGVRFGSRDFSSNQELPFFNIETPQSRGVLVGLGWTGNWQAQFTADGAQLHAQAGMPLTRFRLHPGERVRGPRVLMLFWTGQRLHGHNMLRRILYEHYVPPLPSGKPHEPLVSVNTCFTHHGRGAYLEQVTEQSLLAIVPPFVELGAEAYVIDAGYYNCNHWTDILKTGDFTYSKERFPRGFRPIADPLEKAGVTFGFWFAPELTGQMSDPQARDRFLAVIDGYVKSHGMKMYRQDQGVNPHESLPDRQGIPEMQHIAGLYELQDEIRRRYPFMVMEGCMGGGRRIDLESLARFLWHQKSDSWFRTVSDQSGLCGASFYLPGGVINVPTEATDNFGLWSSFAGQLCLAWHPLDKDFPMEQAKRQVRLYKRVRPLLSGDFYPLTECTLDRPWLAYQFHRSDTNQGFALIFKREASEGDVFTFAPRGLNPEARFSLTLEASGVKAIHTGADLARGIQIPLKATPAAELVIYEQQPSSSTRLSDPIAALSIPGHSGQRLATPVGLPLERTLPGPITDWVLLTANNTAGSEYYLQRQPLGPEGFRFTKRVLRPKEPPSMKPWWLLGNRRTGQGLAVMLAYMGNWTIEVVPKGDQVSLRLDTSPPGLKPFTTIQGLPIPGALVAEFTGHWDYGAQPLVRFVRDKLLRDLGPQWPLVQYNNWYDVKEKTNEQHVIEAARAAAALGCELFTLDAGWYGEGLEANWVGPRGDWQVNRARFPRGVEAVAAEARRLGMKFGLWFDIECAGGQSRVAKEHPDWFLTDLQGRRISQERLPGAVLDFGKPEVLAHVKRVLDDAMAKYALDYIKMDFNSQLTIDNRDIPPDKDPLYRHNRGLAELWSWMHAKYPAIVIEDCSGGSARHELTAESLTDTHWISDNIHNRPNLIMMLGATHLFPAATCSHWTVTPEPKDPVIDLDAQFVLNMMGHFGLSGAIASWDAQTIAIAKDRIAQYKRIRPLLRTADVYHLTTPQLGAMQAALYADPTSGRALLFVFQCGDFSLKHTVRLRGLDAARHYRLSILGGAKGMVEEADANRTVAGKDLVNEGLTITFPRSSAAVPVALEPVAP